MIFKLQYFLSASGYNALDILLGVFIQTYTDASASEIGMLYMIMPFTGIITRPIICSSADREQAHRRYMIIGQMIVAVSYSPFIIIPLLGQNVYQPHPRFCWYFLVVFKVIGDIAFDAVGSICDSLAINYSKRVGSDYSRYRVWGTISWMIFGIIIGQINEIWFLPKYVPGFMILISSALLSILSIWLWPKEYFRMVVISENKDTQQAARSNTKESSRSKSLMPRHVVWAHVKSQLWSLVTCLCIKTTKREDIKEKNPPISVVATADLDAKSVQNHVDLSLSDHRAKGQDDKIDKMTQIRILFLLLRRDPRIVLYLLMFTVTGSTTVPMSFFFMSLSETCHKDNRCDFSQLAGFLQVTMAIIETFLFIYMKQVLSALGRLNLAALAFLTVAVRFLFYGTYWSQVDPYWSLLSEVGTGMSFAIYVTLMVEMGHVFSSEVEHIIPELLEKKIIDKDANYERVNLSLSATMQALITNANDGLGRGVSALIYGVILDRTSYETLWMVVGISSACYFLVTEIINILDYIFKFNLGIKPKHEDEGRMAGCTA